MYAYLSGEYTYKSPTLIHLDVNGIGYLVHISLYTYSAIEALDKGKLYTHLHVKEDAHTLYGFATEEEKELFKLLLSVSGIGPNTARIITSSMTPVEIRTAIVTEDDLAFKKVKGVGPKTAKRLCIDLKDKIKAGAAIIEAAPQVTSGARDQAVDALVALGFTKAKVVKVIDKLGAAPDQTVEQMIKSALQQLT